MHAKNNRQNTDFQIAYFLAGACHTADGAYALLCDLREDRRNALKHAKASSLREQARRLAAQRLAQSDDPIEQLNGQADLAEMDANVATATACHDAAVDELATIERCIELVQPHRRFSHLPDAQAHAAAQHDEWKLELISRAENAMLTTRFIPPDQFATMRLHPAFKAEILPAIMHMRSLLNTPDGERKLLERGGADQRFSFAQLLPAPAYSTTPNLNHNPNHEDQRHVD